VIFSPLAAKLGLGAAGVLSIALMLTGFWGMHQKAKRQAAVAELAQFKAATAEAAAAQSDKNRRKEQEDAERVRLAEATARERQAQHEKALAQVRASADADRRLLVGRIAELGRSLSPESPASATSDGAEAIGGVLEDALRNATEATAAAESNADAYRALREAWAD
jgi:hypothetical protein